MPSDVDQAPPAAPKLVLHWRHRVTGQTGHGEPQSTGVVLAHVEDANKRFPDILHWAEPVPPACEDCNDTGTITDPAPDAPGASPPESCVSCPGRTLPVTPAERALAAVLRAWRDWPGDGCEPEDEDMLDVGAVLRAAGLIDAGEVSARGAALLARVEAAERRSPEDIARDLVMALQTSGAPGVLVSEAQSVLVNVRARARRLAGTTPIDAPRASPERRPRPVPRQECARCDQYYSYGTGVIAPCKDSPYRHGKDGPGWRDPLHKWDTIDAPPAKEPAR